MFECQELALQAQVQPEHDGLDLAQDAVARRSPARLQRQRRAREQALQLGEEAARHDDARRRRRPAPALAATGPGPSARARPRCARCAGGRRSRCAALPTEARSGRWSRSTNATRGRAPASAITAPTSTASASGYTTSSATISGERRRIRRSLASRARIARIRRLASDAARASRKRTNACSNAPALEPSMPARSPELLLGPGEDEAPLLQHDQPIGLRVGLLDVLRREHDGAAAARDAAEELPQPGALARVEARRRLVQEHDRRVGDEADRHVQALDVADRELLRRPVGRVDEVDQTRAGARPRPAGSRAARARRTGAGSPARSACGRARVAAAPSRCARTCARSRPSLGCAAPASSVKSVVLPAPFGPRSATHSPARTSSSIGASATLRA